MNDEIRRWTKAQQAERDHYDTFDRTTWEREYTQRYLDEHFGTDVSDFEGDTVLEVGCGLGLIHALEDCENIGIDPLADELGQYLADDDAETLTGLGERLPFEAGRFDAVFCVNVLDHCANPATVLAEMHRVLSPNGRLYFLVNTFAIPAAIRRPLRLIDRPHPHHFSHAEIVRLVSAADFDIESHSLLDQSIDDRSLSTFVKTAAAKYVFRIGKSTITATKEGA